MKFRYENIIVGGACFLSPFQFTVFNKYTQMISIFFSLMTIFVILKRKEISLDGTARALLILLLLPYFVSMFGLAYASFFVAGKIDFVSVFVLSLGRMFNVFSSVSILILMIIFVRDKKSSFEYKEGIIRLFVNSYLIGCLVLIFFGAWHFVSIKFGFLSFPFETRANLHSVSYSVKDLFNQRVTGISREPSYLAPILIDFILISLIFQSRRYVLFCALSLLLLFYTYSGGGYLDFILVTVFYCSWSAAYFIRKREFNYKAFLVCFVLFAVAMVFAKDVGEFVAPVAMRVPTLFDVNNHSRAAMFIKPFEWAVDSSVVNFFIGHGPKTYSLLGSVYQLSNGDPIHITSNNIFSDYIWEMGAFGILCLMVLLCIGVFASLKNLGRRKSFIGFLLIGHLLATSLYRADYASNRFFIIIFIISWLVYYSKKVEKYYIYTGNNCAKNYTSTI